MESSIYFLVVVMSVSLTVVTSMSDEELQAVLSPLTEDKEQIVSTSECDSGGKCEMHSDKATTTTDDLDTICQDSENWGEMSGCLYGGSNFSVSWCPKFIRNNTIYKQMMVRLNWLETKYSFSTGQQSVTAWIPGFERPIFEKTFTESCEHLLQKLPSFLAGFITCPFSSKEPFLQYLIGQNRTFDNPLETIVPAGSYHLFVNVTNENNKLFFCLDGWLEF